MAEAPGAHGCDDIDDLLEIDHLLDFSVSGSSSFVPSSEPDDSEEFEESYKVNRKRQKKSTNKAENLENHEERDFPDEVQNTVAEEDQQIPDTANNGHIFLDVPEESVESSEPSFGPEKRPKKNRYAEPSKWKKNERKKKRNSGQSYITTKGIIKPSKNCENFNCNCRYKCQNKITFEQCCQNFKTFYSNASWETQSAFLMNAVKVVPVKRKRTNQENSRRGQTREYYLKANGESVLVCKAKFMKTLQVDSARIHRALEKANSGTLEDKRGKHTPANATPDFKLNIIRDHIKSFPSYTSHYRREDSPNMEYLEANLNVTKMYQMYRNEIKTEYSQRNPLDSSDWEKECVSQITYSRVFHKEFNLKFKRPKKDTCKKCDIFKVQLDGEKLQNTPNENVLKTLKRNQELHHRQAEYSETARSLDVESSLDGSCHVVSFDLQKTFPLPKISTNEAYYKRQLTVYNLGIQNLSSKQAHMYVWHEGIASRGAQEIVSCVKKYIQANVREPKLVLWSDSCGGQNRNIKMVLFFMHIVAQENCPVKEIVHRFCISGHSYLPNDRDFSQIENKMRTITNMYGFEEFVDTVKSCKQNKHEFNVTTMNKEDFLSSKVLEELSTNRKKDEDKEKVSWLKMRELKVKRDAPGILYYKYCHNPEVDYYSTDLRKKLKGPPLQLENVQLSLLYPNGNCISAPKLKDIQHLLKYVPPVYQEFYSSLRSDPEVQRDDIDGLPQQLDFDVLSE